jgi:Flp pilus assembly secretin CpaC
VTVPGVTANLALNSADTRLLDDIHMRLQDKDAGTVTIGDKYPIQTSSYSGLTGSTASIPGISSAGLSSELAALGLGGASSTQQPIPQVQYQDIGLNFKITPHILRSKDVALDLELKLQALAGAVIDNIPELTNRQFNATVMAHDGRTTAFLSDLTRQESRAVSGLPGISELPGFQSTTDDTRQVSKSTLLILITPHILRRAQTEVAGPAILLPRHE